MEFFLKTERESFFKNLICHNGLDKKENFALKFQFQFSKLKLDWNELLMIFEKIDDFFRGKKKKGNR